MSGGQSISALGSYGLGSSGAYSSYDPLMMSMMGNYGYGSMTDPAMMMNGGYGMNFMNPMMMPMMGGYGAGMYAADSTGNNSYIDRLTEMYEKYNAMTEKLEERRLQHATEMHRKTQLSEVANLSSHDQAFFLKAVEDGDVQHCVREIHDAIRKQNMAYATKIFYELKQVIFNKFSDYFKTSDGNVNSEEKIKQYICILYSEIAGGYASSGGIKPDLKDDILKYGPTSAEKGFFNSLFGNKKQNKLTGEETLYQMFGTGFEDVDYKEKVEKAAGWAGRTAQVGAAGLIGGAAGITALGTAKFFTPGWITRNCPTNRAIKWATKFKTWGKTGALVAMGADILWQMSR
jgi:hypothetical protein